MKVRFKNSPINELVIATYFNPPLFSLRSEHIGLFWSRIRNEFPAIEQQAPVGGAEAFEQISGEFFPMPRFWFVAEDKVNLIQLQKNAFMLNWRRRDAQYPHFAENLKPAFDKYYRIFEDFACEDVGIDKIEIDLCELTYINTIEACEYWEGPQDTSRVIPSFAMPDAGIEASGQPAFNCTFVYVPSKDLQLRVSIRNGESTARPATPVLVVEIKATGRLGQVGKSAADAWFERAHDAIIACFVGITSKEIQQKYWKPVEEEA
ncbi:TIGR04255 family protein [Alterinioella nitratireducens]|uniref:TIGR04255 family protein n=1 Tax=Alterinioella nitratireducens TaxID=2735915 RepID=UPI001552F589|nr:TIGR04255 family protein [Alterinioella nitratireducens]NPD21735.1 TIGR04255 family protein [Alterinioella nitratireducens]